ncbi:MAG: exodeoxyribonuclease [Patescibacteria group bacterium]|nr:exodeoxyribonuclease [Patescibacteria group bacterium]
MKIVSWNVNGLRAVHKKGLFMPFIEQYQPDIICLQEIKSEKHQNEIDLKGYEEFWNPAQKAGYAGTAIFTKTHPLSVQTNLPEKIVEKYKLDDDQYGNPNKEGRVLALEFSNFYIVTVYTPNSKRELSRLNLRYEKWDPAFLEYIRLLEKKKPVIFCGDLNVAHTEDDLANPKQNEGEHGFTKEERKGVDNIVKAGFIDTFRLFTQGNGYYTWWTHWANARARNVGWRIDYFFASKKLVPHIAFSQILADVTGSDHCPVLVEVNF